MLMRSPVGGVAEVAPDLVERFKAQGWQEVVAPAPKRKPGRPRKSE